MLPLRDQCNSLAYNLPNFSLTYIDALLLSLFYKNESTSYTLFDICFPFKVLVNIFQLEICSFILFFFTIPFHLMDVSNLSPIDEHLNCFKVFIMGILDHLWTSLSVYFYTNLEIFL